TAAKPSTSRACTCPGERNRSTRDPNCDPHRTRQQRCDSNNILRLEFSEEEESPDEATEIQMAPNGAIELR
ncbi:MAG: hypothetical protein D6728_16270, partial [Cyanobacteria bacterium J055]